MGTRSGFPRRYARIPHCLLCGERFSPTAYFRSVSSDQHQGPVLTPMIHFRKKGQEVILQDINVVIHDAPHSRTINAASVHNLCWTVLGKRPSIETLCDLGLAMTPLVWSGLPQSLQEPRLTLPKAIQMLSSELDQSINGHSALPDSLGRCRQLPTELISMIWEYITPCAVRCLLALWAAKSIWPIIPLTAGSATVCLHGDLLLYLTRALHGIYICGIRQGDTFYGHKSTNPVELSVPKSIVAFTFALGTYGLRRMCFLTEGQSAAVSIGAPKTAGTEFTGVIYPQEATPLCVDLSWDALKVSRISCHKKSNFGHDFLWVTPVPKNQLYPLFQESFYSWPRHVDYAATPQRFMAYIPLQEDGFSLYGLTAFCSISGILGLGTHFRSCSHPPKAYWYGQQEGYPIHVQFECSETLRQISVYWHQHDRMFNIYLTVTTSKGTTSALGPYLRPSDMCTKTIFNASDGDILGLYYDKSPDIPGFTSWGAVYPPRKSSPEPIPYRFMPGTLQEPRMINALHTSPFGGFASRASLKNIKSLKACYVGSRCTGILAIHSDDTRSVLGQWYESTQLKPDIQALDYQSHNVLRFFFAQNGGHRILNRVESLSPTSSVNTGEISGDIAYGDEIIWLFSEYDDVIFRG